MATITIDASGMTLIAQRLNLAPQILAEEQLTAMQRATLAVEAGAKAAVRTDTHNLYRSITSVATATEGKVGTNLLYGRVMNDGRAAGAAMPPKGALLAWMARKGIDASQEFVIRRAISRRGIPGDQWLTGTFDRLLPDIRAEFDAIPARLAARVTGGG